MSLQSERRPSSDRRPGDGYERGTRSQPPEPAFKRSPDGANGYGSSDRSIQKAIGESARDDSMTNGSSPGSMGDGRNGRENTQTLAYRDKSRTRTNGAAVAKTPSGTLRVCRKCGESLTGQFVRALGGTFHLECFKCRVRYQLSSALLM